MDHYHYPRNHGCIERKSNATSRMYNPSCGDKIEVQMYIEDGIVTDICFDGHGCALSTASASLLTEFVKGKTISEVSSYTPKDALSLLNIEVSHARMKCALIPFEAIQEAIGKIQMTNIK